MTTTIVFVKIAAYIIVGPQAKTNLEMEQVILDALADDTKLFIKHKVAPRSTIALNS